MAKHNASIRRVSKRTKWRAVRNYATNNANIMSCFLTPVLAGAKIKGER